MAAGAVLSLFAMWLAGKTTKFSITGVSIAGAVFHNIGQVLVLWGISGGDMSLLRLMPVLMIIGMCMGIITGIAASLVLKILPASIY